MLEFGRVVKYFDNGFGFIKPMDPDSEFHKKEIFFHIKSVKKFEDDLVKFSDGKVKELNFWFTYRDGKKGKEVVEFWSDAEDIPREYVPSILDRYSASLIRSANVTQVIPIPIASRPLIPISPVRLTPIKAPNIFSKVNEQEKKILGNFGKYDATFLANKYSLIAIKAEELSALLTDMCKKEFKLSSELSKYIKSNRLGNKYPNIAGVVTMSNGSDEWDFQGGFPKDIYRIICLEMGLRDKGTYAKAIKFTSYKDSKNRFDINNFKP